MKKLYLLSTLCVVSSLFSAAGDEKELRSRGQVVDSLDTGLNDPISDKSFSEIIAANNQASVHSIFARIKHNGDYTIYDAHQFNSLVFGEKCLGKPEADITINKFLDPISKKRIRDIRYFILMQPDDQFLNTIGSFAGMKRDPNRSLFVRALLHANNPNIPLIKRALTFTAIGEKYSLGKGVGADAKRALYWYNKALTQDVNPRARAKAQYQIAQMYREGRAGVAKDYAKAAEHYDKAIELGSTIDLDKNQKISLRSDEWGRFNLARILVQGGHGIEKDWPRAQALLMGLMRHAKTREVGQQAQQLYTRYAQPVDEAAQRAQDGYAASRSDRKYAAFVQRSPEEEAERRVSMSKLYVVDPSQRSGVMDALTRVLNPSDGSDEVELEDSKTPPRGG